MPALIEAAGRGIAIRWPGLGGIDGLRPFCTEPGGARHLAAEWVHTGDADANADAQTWTGICGPIRISLLAVVAGETVTLTLDVEATEAVQITGVGLQGIPELQGQPPGWWIYNGYQSWDAADVIKSSASPRTSWWTCAMADVAGKGIALASASAHRLATRFDLRDGELTAVECAPPGADPVIWSAAAGGRLTLEPLMLTAASGAWNALATVAGNGGSKRVPVPVGWLSWYHYGPWVSEEDVLANSQMLAKGQLRGLGYELVQIDDGWQQTYGDWTANTKFGEGLGALTAKLLANGQVAGLWTAPFLVSASADLAETAPADWFVPDPATGERLIDPVHMSFGPMYVLDARKEAVREHLERVFRELREAGIRYHKIDFLYAGAYAGLEGFRSGLEAIRRGAGDAYILASGAPLQPVVGLVEGCRIGQDTATPIYDFETGLPQAKLFGDEVLWIARNIACRHHLEGWYQLDPDVALVGANLTVGQARQLVTAVVLSGGPFFISDPLPQLSAERLALLTNPDVLDQIGGSPAVPDWEPDSEQLASIWRRGNRVVAAFNWTGGPRRLVVEGTANSRLRDLWQGEEIDLADGRAYLELPEAGVRLLRVDVEGRLKAWLE